MKASKYRFMLDFKKVHTTDPFFMNYSNKKIEAEIVEIDYMVNRVGNLGYVGKRKKGGVSGCFSFQGDSNLKFFKLLLSRDTNLQELSEKIKGHAYSQAGVKSGLKVHWSLCFRKDDGSILPVRLICYFKHRDLKKGERDDKAKLLAAYLWVGCEMNMGSK